MHAPAVVLVDSTKDVIHTCANREWQSANLAITYLGLIIVFDIQSYFLLISLSFV